jgi:hypothetical protein
MDAAAAAAAVPPPPTAVSVKYHSERSAGGFGLSVLKSALQKYIRRGNTVQALRAVREFHSFASAISDGCAAEIIAGVKRIRTNYVHRLMVIAIEDIGDSVFLEMTIPLFRLIAPAGFSCKPAASRQAEAAFVQLACEWPKSRAGSHAKAVATCVGSLPAMALAQQRYPEIDNALRAFQSSRATSPDQDDWPKQFRVALEKRSLTALFWGWHIAENGAGCTPSPRFPRRRKPIWLVLGTLVDVCHSSTNPELLRWAAVSQYFLPHVQNLIERHLYWLLPTLSAIARSPKYPPVPHFDAFFAPEVFVSLYQQVASGPLEIADYVMDQHTGRRVENAGARFASVGCVVEPEVPPCTASFREFYVERKHLDDGAADAGEPRKSEIGSYSFVLRAQLVTGHGKTDTYFAWPRSPREGSLQVVKGPYASAADPSHAVLVNHLKGVLGLPAIRDLRVEHLVPDRWPEGTPLGLRNRLRSAGRGGVEVPFLVGSSWVEERDLITKFHSSKLWPRTIVPDWQTAALAAHAFSPLKKAYSSELFSQYVRTLLLRAALGVGDQADRNFIVIGNGSALASIDEDNTAGFGSGLPGCMIGDLRANKTRMVRGWLEANPGIVAVFLRQLSEHVAAVAIEEDLRRQVQARLSALLEDPALPFRG